MNESARAHDVAWLVAQQELRDLYHRYCRGIDRRDLDLVRDCYHPDATDDHGEYSGGVDGFIDHVRASLTRFERTMHVLGNILVEQSPDDPDEARGEAYGLPTTGSPPRRLDPSATSSSPSGTSTTSLEETASGASHDGSASSSGAAWTLPATTRTGSPNERSAARSTEPTR